MKAKGWICLAGACLFAGYARAQESPRVEGAEAGKKLMPMVPVVGGAKEQIEKEVPQKDGKGKDSGAAAKPAKGSGAPLGNLPHKNREKEPTRFGVISSRGGGAGSPADPLDPGLASWNDRKPANCAPGCDCRNDRFNKGPVENKTRPREIPKAGG